MPVRACPTRTKQLRAPGLVHPARPDKNYREPFDVPRPLLRTEWDRRKRLAGRRNTPARAQLGAIRREMLRARSLRYGVKARRRRGFLPSRRRSPAKFDHREPFDVEYGRPGPPLQRRQCANMSGGTRTHHLGLLPPFLGLSAFLRGIHRSQSTPLF